MCGEYMENIGFYEWAVFIYKLITSNSFCEFHSK